jgi:NitT/TauT family transport system ATP-binding protein
MRDESRDVAEGGLALRLDVVSFRYPSGVEALRDLALEVPAGSLTAVIGPNGCGKSTLLRLLAGLLQPTSGRVSVGGQPPRAGDGRVGLAFQQPRLVPWLTVAENVELPLAAAGVPVAARAPRVVDALARVGLAPVAQLRPAQLSGGLAQRAGLARALITDPGVLLLDEPFSALDLLTREAFDTELEALWIRRRPTLVLVTHSVSEAVLLADRIVVLGPRPGRVVADLAVHLPRPRPVSAQTEPAAVVAAAAVRAALATGHAPETAAWGVS